MSEELRLELVWLQAVRLPIFISMGRTVLPSRASQNMVCDCDKKSHLIGRDVGPKLLKRPLVALTPVSEAITSMSH